ncbi:SET domain-containing protein-lysine N-methyltransferase [Microvirga sp. SYSU G3D207]|uniref:SET domain-containing protein-lysine N-methyltransferase n=1 Tax=Microvirga arsenatis TaxID=2692265 RepID=A0ABW9YT09_9HYPH|nr:SET domain-containing protein-lysine N-methyltransferase [Microvirga arsenatis]NBJ23145.1 SET domain-containing protein-lysine N-methyltransferase [Microvirga arsenatis]
MKNAQPAFSIWRTLLRDPFDGWCAAPDPICTTPSNASELHVTTSTRRPEGPFRIGRSETGLGLFATDVIEKGTFIIEYVGPRITSEEVQRRRNTRYLFEINSRWTIDGSPRWNTARYINHSCRPNAQATVSRGRIRIRAIKRIKPGDEITYNYGKNYFETFIKPVGCKCRSCERKRAKQAGLGG